jgi:Uma2 family endonuclease
MATVPRPKPARESVSLEGFLSGPSRGKPELVYGEVIVRPRRTEAHHDLVHDLGELLKRWTRFWELGKVSYDLDMVLDGEKNLAYSPDLLFVAKDHEDRRRQGRVYGPADLCVEVFLPSDKTYLMGRKFSDYRRYGVTWYWIIDPDPQEPTLEENQLVEGDYVYRSEITGNAWFEPGLFPGLQFRLPPLLAGDLKGAVKGKAKKLV